MIDQAPPGIPLTPAKSGLAIASLVLGIVGFLTCGITSIPAVITGHMALSRIKKSGQTIGGGGFALAGTILGYVFFIIFGLAMVSGVAAPLVIRQKQKADQTKAMANLRQIGLALNEYHADHGTAALPYPADLKQLDSLSITTNIEDLLKLPKSYSGDWLYFPNADPNTPTSPLLISPPLGSTNSNAKQQPVLSCDGAVRLQTRKQINDLVDSSPNPPTLVPVPRN